MTDAAVIEESLGEDRPVDGEESGDVEAEAEPLRAPELTGERLAAARRHTERVARLAERTVRRDRRELREVAFARMSEAELAAHFDDARVMSGEARGQLARRHLVEARSAAEGRADARGPSAAQEAAIVGMEARAMTDVRVDWDDARGSPRRLAGAFHAGRAAAPDIVAREWVDAEWPALAAALGADSDDALALVHLGGLPDELVTLTYRRVRAGVDMPENIVEVHVTADAHPAGAGVILRVEAQWDTDVAEAGSRVDALGEEDAILLAEDALGVRLTADQVDTDLRWRCSRREGPACGPSWRVSYLRETAADDTVYLDARTGEILDRTRASRDYTGHVSQTTRYPYDAADVQRDMRHAHLSQFVYPWFYTSNTDTNGNYNWDALGSTASVGLHNMGQSLVELAHADPATCSPTLAYDWVSFSLSSGASISITPNATTHRRGDWLMYHYLQYAQDLYWDFSNVEEIGQVIWFDAASGAGGQHGGCDATAETQRIVVGNGDDTGDAITFRDVFWEEFSHGTDWCTETVGPGCGYTLVNPRAWSFGWSHQHGGAIGSYINDYETWGRGLAASSHLRYAGLTAVGDLVVHDAELEGTATSGIDGCDPVDGIYNCASTEACFIRRSPDIKAMDRPRCMRRIPAGTPQNQWAAWCVSQFPLQPPDMIDGQPYGSDPANPGGGIGICVSNDYPNGRIFMHLGEHLMNSAGYISGIGAFYRASRALTRTRQFTQTADNFHVQMAPWAGHYEASNAFHNISVESFPWLDDTTDRWNASEVIQIPRNTTLTFTQGGPTGTLLAFDQGLYAPGAVYDRDSFLVMLDQNETYEITASTSSSNVDICVQAWNHLTGASIAQLPTSPNGCTDGVVPAAARNHTFRFSAGSTARLVDFEVRNLLNLTGTYQLQIRNVNDDFADQLSYNFTSQPLQNLQAVSGALTSTDRDLFHYYSPTSSGTLTVTTTGAATSALVEIYQSVGATVPGGSPVASGWGTANTSVIAGRYYYVLVHALGASGSYTLTATHSGCGTCNGNGTHASPMLLPHPSGGIVVNRLDHSALETGYTSWAQCRDGNACDWYAVDLLDNERLSITTFKVTDSLCDVEVAVLAPDEQSYWGDSSLRFPATWDLFGSMVPYGSQLTFVAPRAGTYRIRARGIDPGAWNCPRYEMAVTRGIVDQGPPSIH